MVMVSGQEGGAMDEEEARIMIGAEVNKGQIPVVVGMVLAAYRRGRREAIEEAARWLRAATVADVRAFAESHEMPIDACASAIIRHEAELNKGPARG